MWNSHGKVDWVACKAAIWASVQFSSVAQLCLILSNPWTTAHQATLSITNSRNLLELMSIEMVMPSNHLFLCHPLLSPSIFPSIRVFFNESVLHIRWPKDWSFSFSISPSHEYSGLISFRMDFFDLLVVLYYLNIIDWSYSNIPYLTNLQPQTFVSAKTPQS